MTAKAIYLGTVVGGSLALFGLLPALTYLAGGGYALGVYIGTGIAVLWYTVETYYLRKDTRAGNQARLLRELLQEHTDLGEDRDTIQRYWLSNPATAIERYEAELRALPARSSVKAAHPVHEARRRVSQYFMRLRALCQGGMIDPELVATTLGGEAIQVFVRYIDPLDAAVRRNAGMRHNTRESEYFKAFLRKHFPGGVDQDPWEGGHA